MYYKQKDVHNSEKAKSSGFSILTLADITINNNGKAKHQVTNERMNSIRESFILAQGNEFVGGNVQVCECLTFKKLMGQTFYLFLFLVTYSTETSNC